MLGIPPSLYENKLTKSYLNLDSFVSRIRSKFQTLAFDDLTAYFVLIKHQNDDAHM